MTRRWRAGWQLTLAGLPLRVVNGRKHPDDLRMDWLTPEGGWRAVPMAAGFLLADFWGENEDVLYPNGRGWRYYTEHIEIAARDGWEAAQERLATEQDKKRTALVAVVAVCGMPGPEGTFCAKPRGHDGAHRDAAGDNYWPRTAA